MKKSDIKSILMTLSLLGAIILIVVYMYRCHVVRHYYDSVKISIAPTLPLIDTTIYNLESEIAFDIGSETLSYRFTVFPCDTIVTRDTMNFRYGDDEKKLAIADFLKVSDTLKCYGVVRYNDIASWSACKVINARVSIDNFTLQQFDSSMHVKYSYPFNWLCHNLYSSGAAFINHAFDNTSVTCTGDRDVEIHLYLENSQKVFLNTFFVVLLSTLFGLLIDKLFKHLI